MDKKEGINERFFQFLSDLASRIDDKLRFGDFNWNRTGGGFLDRVFGICRHSYHYLAMPALVAAIIVMGIPEFGLRLFWAAVVFVFVLALLILLARVSIRYRLSVRTELIMQVVVVLGVAALVWMLGGNTYQGGGGIYRHFFVLAALVVGVALIAGGFLAGWIWSRWQIENNYDQAVTKTELFLSRETQIPLGWGNFLRAFLTVIQGAPLQLLLLPAVVALLVPPDILVALTISAFALSYGVLLMGGFDARLNQMWGLLQSAFFRGGTRWVSLIVIGLAAARLLGLTYVTTVFDTAEGIVIALLLLSAYVLFWWYDYWINRLLAQELIKMLNAAAICDMQIPYPIEPDSVRTSVLPDGRVLQIHGASRFIVIGSSEQDAHPRFQAYAFNTLFESLAMGGFPGGKASPSPRQLAERIFDYKCLAGTVLVGLSLFVGWFISSGIQQPQLVVENKIRPHLQFAQLLDDHIRNRDDQPALIIAASGGGTRAALYTAAVMEGLAKRGRIQDVIMGSGVSGGGAALAYFAGNRPMLVESNRDVWDEFFHTMSMPFIQDVLNGALEWRTVTSSRLGVLLMESFERRWKLAETRNKLGAVEDFGLILNTAIAGRFACDRQSEDCLNLPLIQAERRFRKQMTRSEMAGGRLILTNLSLGSGFAPSVAETGGPQGLPVIVHDPGTRLEVAAALNANFPPIFSNAGIDIGGKARYWVTDGGAVDNRGIEMLLYALRETLTDPCGPARTELMPAVTVVVLDASAFSNRYSQDRGVGSLMGAGAQFASLLVEEQLRSIRALYAQRRQSDRFRFIYLPMPLCLRESGSFGTHWMLQPNIEIDLGPHDHRSLKGSEMVDMLRVMHSPDQEGVLAPDAQAVMAYAVKDHRWRAGARELGFIQK
ncbi:MAG: hypothetical protein JSW39_16670 [Desulfobacterales bacterium]|nr:MAG: hypothetical protein JSW39_16670 [Desulfobacterales bacterium]